MAPEAEVCRSASSGWVSRIGWFSGVAASLALAAFLFSQANFGEHERTTALAGARSETRESMEEDHLDEVVVMNESNSAELEDLDVPDWLITAVSLRDEGASKSDRSPLKPNAPGGV